MPEINMLQAINAALTTSMELNPRACVFGEDVGHFGGVFRATSGLQERFGVHRCFNTPITEQGIVGFANGLAAQGAQAIAEIQFADYIFPAFDQIVNETAKFRYRSGNEFDVGNLTIRTPYGGGIAGGLYHSQSPEAFFTHCPGIKVVVPRNAYQAKGLLRASIEADDPVIFFEPKRLYRASISDVPEQDYLLPIGEAEIIKSGSDITLLAWGAQIGMIEQAAEKAEELGISCELIDLITLQPFDWETVAASVKKTGRLIISHEAPVTCGLGAEISAKIQEQCFLHLESPITRVCGLDTPYPLAHEKEYIPDALKIFEAIKYVIDY